MAATKKKKRNARIPKFSPNEPKKLNILRPFGYNFKSPLRRYGK